MDFLVAMKLALTLLLLGIFAYGAISIGNGKVYCKGQWYERQVNPLGYWLTVGLYLIGPPVLLALTWKAG